MSLAILGMGTAVPGTAFSQEEARRIAQTLCRPTPEQETWLPAMYAHSGVARRYMVLAGELLGDVLNRTRTSGSVFLPSGEPGDRGPGTAQRMEHYARHAAPLALQAVGQALAQARIPPDSLTHLITVSCTGFHAPGVDLELIRQLGLPATIERTHVGFMGCHGALNGLRVMRAFADADPAARILLCATELCSVHYFYGWDPQRMIANALFADGSAAVVGAAGTDSAWRMTAAGSCLVPDSADAMSWSIGDHGFEMTLAKKVPPLIAGHLRPWLEEWLSKSGLGLADVGSWAIHPGGPRILAAVEESLDLPAEATWASREILERFGNMSSPTTLFILERLRRGNAPRPCVALAFGPGLIAEAALFR